MATKRPRTVRGVLLAAARLLKRYGWVRGQFYSAGAHCVVGAIRTVSTGSAYDSNRMAYRAIERMRRRVAPGMLLPTWNDMDERTEKQVIAALRAAARGAK